MIAQDHLPIRKQDRSHSNQAHLSFYFHNMDKDRFHYLSLLIPIFEAFIGFKHSPWYSIFIF
ncbi:Uncharacterised protein [Serratia plymuthica]|uniref:Uncharacterized protein n=1 Tax=Serratia plymuthica TaxID=82996 RepID=A0A2X4YBL9_SERPL|nr:Uncharacterised protein [Serratia plymuthica]SQI45874.1 Uncharacterised protein [Serratia plymuthica]